MMKPHHKSYYVYFQKQHDDARIHPIMREVNIIIILNNALARKGTMQESHYFFKKLKHILGIRWTL